jgi:HK97 family phage prohead protease
MVYVEGDLFMAIKKEIRTSQELRAASDFSLTGYAASYGVVSKPIGGAFREIIQRGAFTRCLADLSMRTFDEGDDSDVICDYNHDASCILGRTKNGTLTVSEDERGLKFRCQLNPKSQAHRDLHAAVERGDVDSCSFAFGDVDDDWNENYTGEDGKRCTLRTLRCIRKLYDVAVVNNPAYPQTSVAARALAAAKKPYTKQELDEIRRSLRVAMVADSIRMEKLS